jgi:hypothetical protein
MNQELMDIVLPRLAERLHRHLKRYQSGQLDQAEFTRRFHTMLQRQFAWLTERSVPAVDAAVAIHAAVLVLSAPGLRAEAESLGLPLEVVEHRALCTAAEDIARRHDANERRITDRLATIVARYAE